MTLKKLIELSSDDTWFCVYRKGCYGKKFLLQRDPDVMQNLNPLLRMKIGKISIERLPVVPGSRMKTPMIAVRLEDE